jgi:hypothetical protein
MDNRSDRQELPAAVHNSLNGDDKASADSKASSLDNVIGRAGTADV